MKRMRIQYITSSFESELNGPVVDVIRKLQSYVDKYPNVEMETDETNDGMAVCLLYRREETDEEYNVRLKKEALNNERQLQQKRAQYEALKKEFENG